MKFKSALKSAAHGLLLLLSPRRREIQRLKRRDAEVVRELGRAAQNKILAAAGPPPQLHLQLHPNCPCLLQFPDQPGRRGSLIPLYFPRRQNGICLN